MITSVDTNVFIALWDQEPTISQGAQAALDTAGELGGLVMSAPVFAELMAAPGRTEAFLNRFLEDTGVIVDFDLEEDIWRLAGRSFQAYAGRRRNQGDSGPRRIPADFLIGAHAAHHRHRLLTSDDSLYRAAFPSLVISRVFQSH
ncbi:MAG TPA: type II toxin-antitoxin system VapC family toxin [Capsulimonadaceae bacterium]|nr:type II toxin-antitoxin system VapC family toxin [Capsulimonadaceae bacterium]